MKYLMMVCVDESLVAAGEPEPVEPWVEEMESRGVRVLGDRTRTLRRLDDGAGQGR